jgi:outer membrane biogenesis lipoprotein LolB
MKYLTTIIAVIVLAGCVSNAQLQKNDTPELKAWRQQQMESFRHQGMLH